MSDQTKRVPRNLIETFAKDVRTARQLEKVFLDVTDNMPELIDAIEQQSSVADARSQEAIAKASKALAEAESARFANGPEVLAQLAELRKRQPDDVTGLVYSLLADVAYLKAYGMKPRRVTSASVTINAASSSANYTIANAVDLNTALLLYQGSFTSATGTDSGTASIRFTSSTNVIAERNGTTGTLTVKFQIVEY